MEVRILSGASESESESAAVSNDQQNFIVTVVSRTKANVSSEYSATSGREAARYCTRVRASRGHHRLERSVIINYRRYNRSSNKAVNQRHLAGELKGVTGADDYRSVAQPGSASRLGREGRRFKSCRSD